MGQLINNSKPQSPCQNCVPPDRYVGCHSVCPDYQEFLYKSEIASMKVRERRFNDDVYNEYRKDKKFR